MRKLLFLFLLAGKVYSQTDSLLIKSGSKAPAFIVHLKEGSIQSFSMPYMKRIVLIHFWSSSVMKSRIPLENLDRLAGNYKNARFRNAEGFEVIAIGVQTDKGAWAEAIKADSVFNLTHGLAVRGYQDDVCKRYGITQLPVDLLIDENGVVISINPRIADVEGFLDENRDVQPIKKDVTGTLAQSSNKSEPIRYCKLYLFNYYGDSLQKTTTSDKGSFIFGDVKLNQDFVLKVDNKANINTTDPIALYSPSGEFIMDGRTKNNGFVFPISARSSYKLTVADSNSMTNYLGQIDIIKHLTFFTNGEGLTPQDEKALQSIVQLLQKNSTMKLELTTHTDARMDPMYARELTTNQANAIRSFLEKKGIKASRIKTVSKGNSELRRICEGQIDCREEDHQLNRRVEFLLYRD